MAQYVSGKQLYLEIVKSKEKGELTPEALLLLERMVKEISKIFSYKVEEDKEDCQAFAMEDVIRYWNRFDPAKSTNAFAFYTQMIKHGFAKGWRKLYPVKSTFKVSLNGDKGIYNI